jgi:perosamine synthetase
MTNIAAAIGLAQMEQITSKVSTRRQIAQWYRRYLTDLDVCLDLPVEEAWVTHAYWMFNILLKPNVNISRDLMMMALDAEGIETRPTFYPIHTMPPYADPPVTLPIAEDCASRGITLPTFEALTEEGVGRITNACRTFFRQRAGTD